MQFSFETLEFYRGTSLSHATNYPSIIKPRRDRRPRDSSIRFHEIADAWFERRFGIRYRSQGVFLTSSKVTASTYAATPNHIMRIIPISEYRYCWSPSISDLLFVANEMKDADTDKINRRLDTIEYREDELQDAHKKGHEVMLFCKEYICIPSKFLEENKPEEQKKIILIN